MKKNAAFLLMAAIAYFPIYAQEWVQTIGTPEGGGITEMVINPDNGYIYVTTASFDWPNGDNGGIRRSTDDGNTWENLMDVYNGRTITLAADNNLYASVWDYPAQEALYRYTNDGNLWEVLTFIPTGNNIFSTTVSISTNPNTIFAGTRTGVFRSLDNGSTWNYANNGMPSDSWVRDIEVDSSGIVVAATTHGLFSSDDNGNTWVQATGGGIENDTITKLFFDYPLNGKNGNTRLLAGGNNGNIYGSYAESKYLSVALMAIFGDGETTAFYVLADFNNKIHGVSSWPKGTQPGGFRTSMDDGNTWQETNNGLPNPAQTSALAGKSPQKKAKTDWDPTFYCGLYQNMNGGAKVYKISFDSTFFTAVENRELSGITFEVPQNHPNPFSGKTEIDYYLPTSGKVSLKVFSADGKLIETLTNSKHQKGSYKITWGPEDHSRGVYFYSLKFGDKQIIKKMIVLD